MSSDSWTPAIDRMLTRVDDTAKRVTSGFPHWAHPDTGEWTTTADGDWTGGYWIGMLWLAAVATGDARYRALAEPLAERLRARIDAETVFKSFPVYYGAALGAILHGAPAARDVAVRTARSLAGLYAPALLRRIGCDVVELHCESDGRFPHHLPDPEDEKNVVDLQAKVVEARADLGVAYDGDADRVGVIDERGDRHEADLLLILLARDLLARHPGAKIVFDVKSSQSLVADIERHGGVPVMWKTGHSHLKRKMREEGILLGGEVSGHMFFGENYYGVDDGMLASSKVLELAARSAAPLSALFDSVPHLHATPELKAMCPDAEKFRVVEELSRDLKRRYETIDIDGARVLFPGGGWGLVRASNTNPYLTLRFEARTREELEEMKRIVFEALARYPFVTLPS